MEHEHDLGTYELRVAHFNGNYVVMGDRTKLEPRAHLCEETKAEMRARWAKLPRYYTFAAIDRFSFEETPHFESDDFDQVLSEFHRFEQLMIGGGE